MPTIAPSILSADFGRLADEVRAVTEAGADWIHVDVMDGHFVPPITIGPLIVKAIRPATSLPLDVHLMIEHAERHIDAFVDAGADGLTVHVEACADLPRTFDEIRKRGKRVGLALNPPTPLEHVRPFLSAIDLLLVMSVNPGWGGQTFIPWSLDKMARMRRALPDHVALEVDGGVHEGTARSCVEAGANLLVTGSAVFGTDDPAAAYTAIAAAAGVA